MKKKQINDVPAKMKELENYAVRLDREKGDE